MTVQQSDNRKFRRLTQGLKVRCLFSDLSSESDALGVECSSSDISIGGMRINLTKVVSLGQRVQFSIFNEEVKAWFPYTQGMIAWASEPSINGDRNLGVCFSPDQTLISEYIRKLLADKDLSCDISINDDKLSIDIEPAYDGSKVTFKLLRLFGWGPLNNLGFFRFCAPLDLLNLISAGLKGKLVYLLPDAQKRLINNSAKLLNILPGDKVLDVACGKGFSSFIVASRYPNAHVTGVDLLNRNMQAAKALYGGAHNLRYLVDNAMDLHFTDESLDKIMCVEAAFHFPDRQKFLSEVYRLLKPGGRLVLVDFMWTSKTDRPEPSDERANLVKSEWQWTDFSTVQEYNDMLLNCGFRPPKQKNWSKWVSGPLELTFLMVTFLGSFSIGKKILRLINPLTAALSISEWNELEESARAHNYLRKKVQYIAVIVEK